MKNLQLATLGIACLIALPLAAADPPADAVARLVATLQQMWRVAALQDGKPNAGRYGYGWFIGNKRGHHVVEHEGQWQGFETQISRYVDDGLTVVVLTNLAQAQPERIADGVAAIYFSRNPPP